MTIQEGAPAGGGGGGCRGRGSTDLHHRPKLGTLMHSDPPSFINNLNDDDTNYQTTNPYAHRYSNASTGTPLLNSYSPSPSPSPNYPMSPWNPTSPFQTSPWIHSSPLQFQSTQTGLIFSLVRTEGHVYSLAVSGDLLYTGSDSKNIRVWKSLKDFSGFKSSSGLVKAIVISGAKIFTGHQDGKIRVWKHYPKSPWKPYKRVGELPTTKDFIKSSMNPSNYVKVRHRFNVPWIKHFDAVSCMSLDREQGILYSGSWDKTVKVWRVSDSKCLESIDAHDDAVNAVVSFEGLVLTGSADGRVRVWRREVVGKCTKHVRVQTLLRQDSAVTALAVNATAGVVYGGSSDGLVNFWERGKHGLLSHGGVLRGHKLAVLCLAAAGNLVLSGSADKSIGVWRREVGGDHTWLSVLTGHCGPVKCLAVEEDREPPPSRGGGGDDPRWVVYSGSLDKSVKVWRVSERFPVG